MSCTRDTETNDNLPTAGQNSLDFEDNFYSFKPKIICVLHGFGCPILHVTNHTLGKQMPPDLAVLLAFSIETID